MIGISKRFVKHAADVLCEVTRGILVGMWHEMQCTMKMRSLAVVVQKKKDRTEQIRSGPCGQ